MYLTIFYDGRCPLCAAEMRHLQACDTAGVIRFEDLNAGDFPRRYPHIDPVAADRVLHGQLDSGKVLQGLDVTCTAWSLVGRYRWLAVLRWPLVRPLADQAYRVFARHRHTISRWFARGTGCACGLPDKRDSGTPEKQEYTS